MTAQEDFLIRIKDLKKQAIRRSFLRAVADALFFSLLFSAGAIVVQKARVVTWQGYGIFPLVVLLAICVSALLEIRKRRHFVDELIDIDLEFKLKELLSSTYECLKLKSKSIFVDPLAEEGSRFLKRFAAGELIPSRLLWRHISIPVLAILMILLLTTDFLPAKTKPNAEKNIILDQIAHKIQRFSKRQQRSSEKLAKKRKDTLFKKVEALERRLRYRSIKPEKIRQSFRELLEEAQKSQADLAGQLTEELSLKSIATFPTLKPELREGIPARNIKRAEDILGESFEGKIPSTLSDKILEIKRYNEIQQFFSRTLDDIESYLETDPKQGSSDGLAKGEPSDMEKNAPSNSLNRATKRGSGKEGDGGPDQENAFTAGRGEDTQGNRQSHVIKGSRNTPVQDRTLVGLGKRYNVFVRSLPIVESAKVKPEELIQSYRNEMEEVLTNEEIPLNYREYIKNYFLAIGIKREK